MKGFFKRWLVGVALWALVIGVVGGVMWEAIYGNSVLVARIDWRSVKGVVTWLMWLQLWWSIGAWFRANRRKA